MKKIITPLIPAYKLNVNEIDTILNHLPSEFSKPFFIINDCPDDTVSYLNILSKKNEVAVHALPSQIGKAEVIRKGLSAIIDSNLSTDIIVQLDGRNKQLCNQTKEHCYKLIHEQLDMVITNRYQFQNIENQPHRKGVTVFLNTIITSIFPNYNFTDMVCGTRAYTLELAFKIINSICFGYGIEIEEILIAGTNEMKIGEIGVSSNLQHSATNASKIEDVLYSILNYSNIIGYEKDIIYSLSNALVNIKKRQNFHFCLSNLKKTGTLYFQYISSPIVNAYTSGTANDGYSIFFRP